MEFKEKPQSLLANVNWIKTPMKYVLEIDDISKFRILHKKGKAIKVHKSRNLINQSRLNRLDLMEFLIFTKISANSHNNEMIILQPDH